MVGPCQSGKTMISNFVSDATESVGGEYRPTAGARILEFEMPSINVNNKVSCVEITVSISSFHINIDQNVKAEVELWDVSGSNQYESCWSAIQRDAHGVIFVFNPESAAQAKNLDSFHQSFVQGRNVPDTACVVFAHFLSSSQVNSYSWMSNFNLIRIRNILSLVRRGEELSYQVSSREWPSWR